MPGYAIETAIGRLTDHRSVACATGPGDGEAIARIDRAAITANNVTYAVHHGPPLHYGRFFPTTAPGQRITVPLWGFATIAASRADGVAEGMRFYGYWPAASHVRLQPGPAGPAGLADLAPHRAGLAAVYNQYVPASPDPDPQAEAMAALFRPLFGTAFALDDVLGRAAVAPTIVLTSASSKTALGTAWLLGRRAGITVIGLTSPANLAFTRSTGCYHEVLPYDRVEALDPRAPTVLVDLAGNGALKARLHAHLSGLVASHIVGDTHWDAAPPGALPGPAPALFFAPTAIADMVARDGAAAFQHALAAALGAFGADARRWLRLVSHRGEAGFAEAFNALAEGRADPAEGHVWMP